MGRIWFVPLLLAAWVCGAETVHACSCTPRSTSCGPPADFWRASDVFSARVVAIEGGNRSTERRVQAQIIERWRGNVPTSGTVVVVTGPSSLCGYQFREGREYVIYASRTEDGRIATSICSGTTPLEPAAEHINYARAALKGIVPAGRLSGLVRLASKRQRQQGVPSVRVLIRHEGIVHETLTDRQGRYTFELAAAGRYHLEVALPETHYARESRQIVDVVDRRACVERDVDVLFDGRVSGRVIDAKGRGVAGLPVAHVPLSDPSAGRTSVLTRDDGFFEIGRLQPGPFEIQFEVPADRAGDGVEFSTEGTITPVREQLLGAGQRLSIGTVSLPPTVELTRLEGMVVGADGWSMADARVFLKGESGARLLGLPAITDALGRFVLSVAHGARYQVFAERPSGESECSDPVSINAEQGMAPLRLVVRRRF